MAGDEAKLKKARTRSPAYPYLALPEALERTAQLRRAEGRHAISVGVAMQHWGYKAESSTGYSCIAALKKFGLVDEEGVGEHREVRLSALALALLLDAGEGSSERATALRTAALNPRIHAELWERYGPELPSDQTLRRFLLLEKSFNEASVDEFISEYRATVAYAGLSESVNVGAPHPGPAAGGLPRRSSPAGGTATSPRGGRPSNGPALPGLERDEPAFSAPPRRESSPGAGRAPSAGAPGSGERSPGFPVPSSVVAPPEPAVAAAATAPASAAPPEAIVPGPAPEGSRVLPVPLDRDLVVHVPYPMSEESFALLMDTLQLWKKRLVRPPA